MQTVNLPLKPQRNALILNGKRNPLLNLRCGFTRLDWLSYERIIIVDGAWNDFSISELGIELIEKYSYKLLCLGDGDSIQNAPRFFLKAPDQNFTDFEKALLFCREKQIKEADVFWGSGGEMDHFLGNLSVAAKYENEINLRFIDQLQCYFYLKNTLVINNAVGHMVTIYPFPEVTINSQGLVYELNHLALSLVTQQSLRNQIKSNQVEIKTLRGNSWIFLHLCSKS